MKCSRNLRALHEREKPHSDEWGFVFWCVLMGNKTRAMAREMRLLCLSCRQLDPWEWVRLVDDFSSLRNQTALL